jgi:hypothetical protein
MRNHPVFFFFSLHLQVSCSCISNWTLFFSSLTKGEAAGSLAILCFSFYNFIKADTVGAVLMQFFFFFFLSTVLQLHCWCITSAPFSFPSFICNEAAGK